MPKKENASRRQNKDISGNRSKLSTKILLAAMVIFALAVSVFILSKQSLRLDEAQSLWQSSRSPSGIFDVIAKDVHVPLYPLLLHYWESFVGDGVYQVRILSLGFFLASIPATFVLGKLAYNRTIGLFGALLVAISPFLNWYGNEIRMYSLLLLLTLANQFFFVKLFKNKDALTADQQTAAWWGYGLSALFGIYTHYFFWFILLTQAIFFMLYRKNFPDRAFGKLLLIAFILFAAAAPWIAYVLHIGQISNAEPILSRPGSVNFFSTFSQFLFGFQDDHLNTILLSLWPLSVLFGFLSLRKHQKIPAQTVYFFLSAILPIIAAFAVSVFFIPLFLTRYLILTVPSLFLFLSWVLATYPKKLSISLQFALVAIMLLTLVKQVKSADTPVKEDYRSVSSYLDQNANAQDVVIISAPFTVYPIEYYYRGPASLETLPIWNRFLSGAIPVFNEQQLPAEVAQLKGSHQRAFVVLSYNQGYENNIKTYFETHFQRLDQKSFSPDLNVYVYQLRYDSPSFTEIIRAAQQTQPGG